MRAEEREAAYDLVLDCKEVREGHGEIGHAAVRLDVDAGADGSVVIADRQMPHVVVRHQLGKQA